MARFPYKLAHDDRPVLGLIVLQVDETVEEDFRRIFPPESVRLHITRIPSGDALTPDTIAEMERTLPGAAALLPPAASFDAIGYACTSGTTLIGEPRVRELVSGVARTRAVTNPLTATLAAIRHLGLDRVGIVSPYIDSIAAPIRRAFETQGVRVPATLSFGEEIEANVARISADSIREAAHALAGQAEMDGLFLSCTNLRTAAILPRIEAELGLPVLSSNQTLAWHMAQLAGIGGPLPGPGRLWDV